MFISPDIEVGSVITLIVLVSLYFAINQPRKIRSEFSAQIANYSLELKTLSKKLDETESKLNDAMRRLESLSNENLRQRGINLWLRIQLREHGVEIEPLPEYLREASDMQPSVNVNVGDSGISVQGGKLESKNDFVGGDKRWGIDK